MEWKMSTSSKLGAASTGFSPLGGCGAPGAYEVIGSFIGMGMVGFWFGIGVMLAVKTVNSLECCIEELISRKYGYCQ